jgi:hypothetical protein
MIGYVRLFIVWIAVALAVVETVNFAARIGTPPDLPGQSRADVVNANQLAGSPHVDRRAANLPIASAGSAEFDSRLIFDEIRARPDGRAPWRAR